MDESILSVTEARHLMPKTTSGKSDEEVEQIISNLEILADSVIKAVRFDDDFRVNIAYNRGTETE